jgi:ribosomal protein S18 acetylase RimI-like enzyme
MLLSEAEAVSNLVLNTFSTFIAPGYSDEGKLTFTAFVQPQRIVERHNSGHFTLVAESEGMIVGMIQVRRPSHVLLLFVDGQEHRRGVARRLVETALEKICSEEAAVNEVTVNSTPYAVEVYRRLGFEYAGGEESREGIVFTPMVKQVRASV